MVPDSKLPRYTLLKKRIHQTKRDISHLGQVVPSNDLITSDELLLGQLALSCIEPKSPTPI